MKFARVSQYILAKRVAERLDLPEELVHKVLGETWRQIEDCLLNGREVHIRSFVRFTLSWFESSKANFSQGLVLGRYVLKVAPSKRLKVALAVSELSAIERFMREKRQKKQKKQKRLS
jgi:nucleoid DNA-binding protein